MSGRPVRWKWFAGGAACLSTCFAAAGCQEAKKPEPPKATPVVLYSTPVEGEVTDYEDFTGRTDAVHSVEVRARVTGYLNSTNFEDGSEVKQGDVLFEIDPRPYRAALDQAEAALAQAEAKAKSAETEYRRSLTLYNRSNITREELDLDADASAEMRAGVESARATRDLAKLDLEFTRVTAPIDGRISRRMVDPGNLVQADITPLTTIVSLDPMYVYFDVDERTLLRIRRLIREGRIKSRTEEAVTFLVGLADEEGFPHQGTIDFSENKVDPNTGTLRVRGLIENPKPHIFSPGLFLRVRLPIGKPHRAMMIAEQAVGTDQGRKFLYVVNDKDEVDYRPVRVGTLDERGMRVIEEGVKPGERVVVSGLQRIRGEGMKVVAKPAEEFASAEPSKEGAGATPAPVPVSNPAPADPARPVTNPTPVVSSAG